MNVKNRKGSAVAVIRLLRVWAAEEKNDKIRHGYLRGIAALQRFHGFKFRM